MIAPGEPTGSSPMIQWLRRLRGFCLSLRIKPGKGYLIHQSTDGFSLDIRPGGAGGTSSGAISKYLVDSVEGDYLVAHSSGSTDSVYLAKPYKLRHSIGGETIDGITVTYSYSTQSDLLDKVRTAVSADVTEAQIVTPRWLDDDEVWGMSATPGVNYTVVSGTVTTTAACSILDLNVDGRAWAVKYE